MRPTSLVFSLRMGRGVGWSDEDIKKMEAYVISNLGPLEVSRRHTDWPLSSIKKLYARLKRGEPATKYKGRAPKHGEEKKAALDELVEENPRTSVAQMTQLLKDKGHPMSWSAVRLHMKKQHSPFKPVKRQRISDKNRVMRKTFCQKMLLRLQAKDGRRLLSKVRPLKLAHIVFSDEKLFKCEPDICSQNNRVWLKSDKKKKEHFKSPETKKLLVEEKIQRSKGVMVATGFSLHTGLIAPHFVPPGVKIDSKAYISILEDHYGPKIAASGTGPGGESFLDLFCWQQDNAPAHSATETKKWFKDHWPGVEILQWPASSPDLNPMDYAVWGAWEKVLGGKKFASQAELKTAIATAFVQLNLDYAESLEQSVKDWPKRLRACVDADGSHFEI